MTKPREFPLRPHGQPWPGLKDAESRLMQRGGEMSDCTNVIINTSDVLSKRKGFIRAFDERFGGVICGIFKYTDEYGREKMILASEGLFYIRSPYSVPTFTQSDAYPFDSFPDGDSDSIPVDTTTWRGPTTRYEVFDDTMRLASGATPGTNKADFPARCIRWFKEQTSRSYQVRIQYELTNSTEQSLFICIKGQSSLDSGALLMAVLDHQADGSLKMSIYDRDAANNLTLHDEIVSSGTAGFLTLEYNQTTRRARATLDPVGAVQATVSTVEFTQVRDLDFGQNCGIGTAKKVATGNPDKILVVDGGPI